MSRYVVGVPQARAIADYAIDHMIHDQGRMPAMSAPVEFVASAAFAASMVFVILLAL